MRKVIALVTLIFCLAAASAAWAAVQGTFDRTLNVSGPVDLDVATGSGNITVTTGTAGTVRVHGVIRVNENERDASQKLQAIQQKPPIEQNGATIKIGRLDEGMRNVSISYELVVPQETHLTSRSGSGDQNVTGIHGPLEAVAGSGNVRAQQIGGEVRANTGSGNIEVHQISGAVHANTGSGNITGSGIAGAIEAAAGSGDISMEQSAAGNVRIKTGSGNAQVRGVKGALLMGTGSGDVRAEGEPTGDWKVETGSGNLHLELRGSRGYDLVAHTSSGQIRLDAPLTTGGQLNPANGTTLQGRRTKEVRGKVRGGGYLVELRTSSGDVEVR